MTIEFIDLKAQQARIKDKLDARIQAVPPVSILGAAAANALPAVSASAGTAASVPSAILLSRSIFMDSPLYSCFAAAA